mgnify:CR=1 FL=1
MILRPGTFLQDRYEILEQIAPAACLWYIKQNAIS